MNPATMNHLTSRLEQGPVVPLIQASHPEQAVQIAQALVSGGLTVLEVVLRTPGAVKCITAVKAAVPDAIVGAGTVINERQLSEAAEAGAEFIVSPGFDPELVAYGMDTGLPQIPGISTPSEAQVARKMGLQVLKFFPGSLAGGVPMLKALGSVFQDVRFMPTGGVSPSNLTEFLALPQVIACGGSWITPKSAIEEGNFETITALAEEALAIAQESR